MFSSHAAEIERARIVAGFAEAPAEIGDLQEASEPSQHHFSHPMLTWWEALRIQAGLEHAYFWRLSVISLVTALGFVVIGVLSQRFSVAALGIAPAMALIFTVARRTYRRAESFERDYPALLISLASSVRTGLDPLIALCQSDGLFQRDSEVARAVVSFRREIDAGFSEERSIARFAADIRHPDIALFRSAFLLARRQGSSLGECLHRLAKVTRQRQSFRRKIRSAVAMQKLSAFGIAGCAIVIGIIQYLSNPEAIDAAFRHPLGFRLLLAGLGLIISGLVWMVFMAKSRI